MVIKDKETKSVNKKYRRERVEIKIQERKSVSKKYQRERVLIKNRGEKVREEEGSYDMHN